MIIVHTGNGKGKTTASVGIAVRALGQNLRVGFCQFMKRDNKAGEQVFLQKILGDNFYVGGIGFFTKEETREAHRNAALNVLAWAEAHIASLDMLVMDEVLYAVKSGLITEDELHTCVQKARTANIHLVLSGRGVPQWLLAEADTITEMTPIKHAYEKGIPATKGIEF